MGTHYGYRGSLHLDGSASDKAAKSAMHIKNIKPYATDGVYWIDLPTVGPTQVYCLMDNKWDGGGWMMAMKATRGTTFNYNSSYWTAVNTLNPTDNTQNDADAKFNTMNYFAAKDILARWPDIAQGGSLQNCGAWTWLQKSFNSGTRSTLINFFNTSAQTKVLDGKSFSGWASGVFSSQSGTQWYGFNFTQFASAKVRWGFAWNNEVNDLNSNDVIGGIGLSSTNIGGQTNNFSYSAGDGIGCCADTTGINRSARVEVYIR